MKLRSVNLPSPVSLWLPFAVITTILSLLIYVAVQQNLRQGANEIPLQLAEDTSSRLAAGYPSSFGNYSIDISNSLTPFVVIYNEAGQAVEGSGMLHDQLPKIPSGVLEYARHHQDNRVTWQPENGVRIASVVKHYSGAHSGFVLAGRNLRDVEQREQLLVMQVLGGWLTALMASFVTVAILTQKEKK